MSVGEDGGDTATLLGLARWVDTPLSVLTTAMACPSVRAALTLRLVCLTQPVTLISPSVWPTVVRSKLTWRARNRGRCPRGVAGCRRGRDPPVGPGEFTAELASTGNGIVLTDNSGGVTGTFTVTPANGSRAAEALGLLAHFGNVISGEDRSMVAVESLFTHLKALERALLQNDNWSIERAAKDLQDDLDRLIDVRGAAGARGDRLLLAKDRESELSIMEASLLGEAVTWI